MSFSKVVPSVHYLTHPQHLKNHFSLQKILLYIEYSINKLVSPKFNPFYYLGAISTLFFIILFISGIYLFIFYRTNNPYKIVQDLTEKQWYLGGIMRSAHRYSSDGLLFSLILHTLREFLYGRYRRHRWLAWISGVILLFITLIIGIVGYWLVWDERAQLIALKSMELLNDIPFFIEPLPRSFLGNESLNAMLFFLLHLIHLGIPLIMIILIGIHIMRCSRPVLSPPRGITIGILIMVFIMSIFIPAKSALPADLNILPTDTPFDWFYFFIYPAMTIIPKPLFWSITIGLTIILFVMPWIKRDRSPVAQVELINCIGCDQCNKDCPYGAIKLQPRSDGLPFKAEAVVIPKRCVSCGICVGSCDFNAINLPDITDIQVKEKIKNLLSFVDRIDKPKILLLICEKSLKFNSIADISSGSFKGMSNVKVISLPCIGMVQPSMIETGLESGADGVFIAGCTIGDCHYRKGNIWLKARLRDQRPPSLNRTIDRQRIKEYWLSPINIDTLKEEILLFEECLNTYISENKKQQFIKPIVEMKEYSKRKILFFSFFLLLIPTLFISFFSIKPTYPFYSKDKALIKFTFKHSGKQLDCRELTEDDTKEKLIHMRKTNSPFAKIRTECKRKRLPTYVELYLDNNIILSKTYYPTGMRGDSPTFAYEEIPVPPGIHQIRVKIRDTKESDFFDYIVDLKIENKKEKVSVIDLSGIFKYSNST